MMISLLVAAFASLCFAQSYEDYCFGGASVVNTSTAGFALQKIVLLTRHGDRTPVNVLPAALEQGVVWNCSLQLLAAQAGTSDVTAPSRIWRKTYFRGPQVLPGSDCLFGQLTEKGASQHRQVGAALRATYVPGLLSSTLDVSQLYVRSTDVERTILSAYNLLEGLYPSSSNPSPSLLTLNVVDEATDTSSGPNSQLCPRLRSLYTQMYASQNYTSFFDAKLGALVAKYSLAWNMTVTRSFMSQLNDVLRSRLCHDMPLPAPMTLDDAELILTTMSALSQMAESPQQILSLSTYPFLAEWVDALQNKGVTSNAALVYFSAHDSTIRNFLLALHASDNRWPPLASHVVIELYQESATGNLFVQMQFDGQVRTMLPPCNAPMCAMSDFLSLVNSYKFDPKDCFAKS